MLLTDKGVRFFGLFGLLKICHTYPKMVKPGRSHDLPKSLFGLLKICHTYPKMVKPGRSHDLPKEDPKNT